MHVTALPLEDLARKSDLNLSVGKSHYLEFLLTLIMTGHTAQSQAFVLFALRLTNSGTLLLGVLIQDALIITTKSKSISKASSPCQHLHNSIALKAAGLVLNCIQQVYSFMDAAIIIRQSTMPLLSTKIHVLEVNTVRTMPQNSCGKIMFYKQWLCLAIAIENIYPWNVKNQYKLLPPNYTSLVCPTSSPIWPSISTSSSQLPTPDTSIGISTIVPLGIGGKYSCS